MASHTGVEATEQTAECQTGLPASVDISSKGPSQDLYSCQIKVTFAWQKINVHTCMCGYGGLKGTTHLSGNTAI